MIITMASILLIVLNSCVSRKKLTYLQYSGGSGEYEFTDGDPRVAVTPSAYKVMPYDNLFIRVVTPDPQWSELFNIPTGMTGLTQESASLSGFSVDVNGYIEIPFVGKVFVVNKTLSEIKTELDSIFKNYVSDASITVRLVNNFISIIGEVNGPGRYHLSKDRINVLEALAMAGDLSDYGNRQKVQLIRPTPYGPSIKEFSLKDRAILQSEFYYIMPNDIIYVVPIQARSFEINSFIWTFFFTTLSSTLAIVAFFRTL